MMLLLAEYADRMPIMGIQKNTSPPSFPRRRESRSLDLQ